MSAVQADWIKGTFADTAGTFASVAGRFPIVDTPRARNTDPTTSHEAADAIKASGDLGRQQQAVLAAVRRWPGLTSLELGARMSLDRWAVARRLPELEGIHVRKGEPRVVNGRRHVTWWPA
jgi:hypothetical protein